MYKEDFVAWLKNLVTPKVISDYLSRCQRVERELSIDLDDEFKKDCGCSLLEKLSGKTVDNGGVQGSQISFRDGADLYSGLSSLKSAVKKYFEFCTKKLGSDSVNYDQYKNDITCRPKNKIKIQTSMDSYSEFLSYFKIDKKNFFEWGISSVIFPSVENVLTEWENLKRRIITNQPVFIRGYGRDAHGTQLYINFYSFLFNNKHITKDPTNNRYPHALIEKMTGLKRNKDIYNYQVSHIWGRTKNIFLFEAPWNICYVPKIIDPFTGHEAKGIWPAEFQKMFIATAQDLYKDFIYEYNDMLLQLNIKKQLEKYVASLNGVVSEKNRLQFYKDALEELSLIEKR